MKRILLFTILAAICGLTIARPNPTLRPNPTKKVDSRAAMFAETCEPATQSTDLDINNVRTKLLNGGDMWWDLNNPKYEIPKVNDPTAVRKHSLYAGAIWIGGKDVGGNLKMAAMTYRVAGSDFWPGPLDTTTASTDPTRCKNYDKMWKVTRDELERWEASGHVDISASIKEWPAGKNRSQRIGNEANFMAPYYESGTTGSDDYDPITSDDHPVLDDRRPREDNGIDKQPDMMIWWVFNDKGNIHSETQGQPIGVECQTSAFAFATNDEVNNMTFYTTKIINRGFTKLNECYMGQWVDPDLGNYSDDYVGCDVGRSLGYCYNGDDDDEGVLGYGLNPPAVGVDYFEGPLDDNNVQMGLSHFMTYNNSADPVRGDPTIAIQYYNYLQGKWRNGQTVTWGGTGFGGSRQSKYMFPATTDADFPGECWDEKSAGIQPGDRRFLQSTGPFTLKWGEVQRITVGVVWARATSGGAGNACLGTGSLGLLKLASDKAQTLFNNNFKILDGPNAPDVELQELENELVLKFLNTNTAKVENYAEKYKNAQGVAKTYKFEGYMVYQLKDATVNTGDLDNVDRARLLFQCDIQNGRGQIINKVFDPKLNALIPVEKVDGADAGISHTFNIKSDLFATTANTELVNFKSYYYMVLSYAILSDDPALTDPDQFLAGRRNINVYKGIPHKTEPENFGTLLNSGYGSGPKLKRIEGRGNGGNVLEFTQETIDEILKNNYSDQPTYLGGFGPVAVKVVDPLKVPNGDFELYFRERTPSQTLFLRDSMTSNTYWVLVNKTTGDSISSDTTIGSKYESVQGRKFEIVNSTTKRNFQNAHPATTLADWGMSVEITQTYNPGENSVGDPTNGLISWSVEWEDNGKQWLTAIKDDDAQATPTSPAKWLNWIRGGQTGRGATKFDPYTHSYFQIEGDGQTTTNTGPLDPSGSFQTIWNGRIGPYALAARAGYDATSGNNTYGPAWYGNFNGDLPLSELASIELVITRDKTQWTRCPVFEMADDELNKSTEGNMLKFNLRAGKSKDINLKDQLSGQGLSWFPGYAINMETGERLKIAFGENSFLQGENGRDMIWNPTDQIYSGAYPAVGGGHFIYIFGTGWTGPGRKIEGHRYFGPDDANFSDFTSALLTANPNDLAKRKLLSSIMWVIPAYMAPGYSMKDGMPPTMVRFKINMKKAYTTFNPGAGRNNGRPIYSFNTNDIAPVVSKENGKKNLDLVNIVPNPYRGYSQYETSPIDSRVKITNLPPECTITIYDMAGNLIRRITKADDATYVDWDLKNNSNVPIASGLYLIHLKTKELGERILRWYGIMHSIDLDSY